MKNLKQNNSDVNRPISPVKLLVKRLKLWIDQKLSTTPKAKTASNGAYMPETFKIRIERKLVNGRMVIVHHLLQPGKTDKEDFEALMEIYQTEKVLQKSLCAIFPELKPNNARIRSIENDLVACLSNYMPEDLKNTLHELKIKTT